MVQTTDSSTLPAKESANSPVPLLFTPIKIGSVTLKNRIVISPMAQYSCVDGFVTDWHLVHLGARAIGGAAVVMVEATAVEKRGRVTPDDAGIWKDEHIPPLKRVADFIRGQNSIPAIQLAHGGRKASTYPPFISFSKAVTPEDGAWQPIGPSPIAFGGGNDVVPTEATLEDIACFRKSFVDAARRSLDAGFQLIELHFAHGYLLQTFLSPYSNKRTDQYGGSFENRIRLALEIVADVKAVVPKEFPLFLRISCSDNLPDDQGWTIEESIKFAQKLKATGVHLVDCSSGLNAYYAKSSLTKGTAVNQIEMAAIIQEKSGLATGAVGGIVNPLWAEQILQEGKATLVLIGRGSLDDPNWPLHAAAKLGFAEYQVPYQYKWAIARESSTAWRQTILAGNNAEQLQ